jgi:retron-type reverse transcriptase
MRRAKHLLERIEDPDNLRLAFWKARKGKSHSDAVERYRANLGDNLLTLREQIQTGKVSVGDYHFFKVYEPKERQICAAAFSEQVLHHALMNVCHEHFERGLVSQSYACRKGKGTYAALEKAQNLTRSRAWFLKLDVRKFFESVHHTVLKAQLRRLFKEERLLYIFDQLIDSYVAGRLVDLTTFQKLSNLEPKQATGLPIGNLTSQYFANHYLSGLDHFIATKLGIGDFVRYMDDVVIWHDSKEKLREVHRAIQRFLGEELHCELKPEQLNRCNTGLPFLGYHIFPQQRRLLQQSKRRFINKWKFAEKQLELGIWGQATYQRHLLPLLAFVKHADTEHFRRKLIFGQSP